MSITQKVIYDDDLHEQEDPLGAGWATNEESDRERRGNGSAGTQKLSIYDFYAYLPQHSYIYVSTRELWPASSVNARLKGADSEATKANAWLDKHRSVEQMTWAPGKPMIIDDRLINQGGWIDRPSARVFNLYLPPKISPGDPGKAAPWLGLLERLYPDDCRHIEKWCAHRFSGHTRKSTTPWFWAGSKASGRTLCSSPLSTPSVPGISLRA